MMFVKIKAHLRLHLFPTLKREKTMTQHEQLNWLRKQKRNNPTLAVKTKSWLPPLGGILPSVLNDAYADYKFL